MTQETYDLIIIGGGPGGYSAAIYAARYNMKTLVIAKERGGLITKTHLIENFPGIITATGFELMDKIEKHVKHYNIPIVDDIVIQAKKEGDNFKLTTQGEKEYIAKSVVLATGSNRRKLNILGEKEFDGKGVSYCATCDAMFFRGKDACIVGGSDSAAKEALMLSEHCKKVYIIYRQQKLRAEPINYDRVIAKDNIEIIYNTNIKEIKGEQVVQKVILDNEYKGSNELELQGVFIEIGQLPNSKIAKDLGCKLNDKDEIIVNREMRTNVQKVYAIGDVTDFKFRQAIVAASAGSISAWSAYTDLN